MSGRKNPNEPISNLEIGTVIEVDGTHIIAELDPEITELSRVYGGTIYPIGQFGSIIKIHFGARLIFGYVGRLRMKSEYEREKGLVPESGGTARIIEADLFGEGEWAFENEDWKLNFERGVTTFPLPATKGLPDAPAPSWVSYMEKEPARPSFLVNMLALVERPATRK